jgi:hypothetical protein
MLKPAIRIGTVAALTLVAGVAAAQPPGAPPAATAPAAGQAYRVKQVLGAKVNIQGNVSIGTVDDIVFDDSGAIEYLIVNNENKLVTVPWQAAKFNFTDSSAPPTAVVNITETQFRAIPTYTVRTYPTFYAPTYRTEIYRHYGLTPGQIRRLERR